MFARIAAAVFILNFAAVLGGILEVRSGWTITETRPFQFGFGSVAESLARYIKADLKSDSSLQTLSASLQSADRIIGADALYLLGPDGEVLYQGAEPGGSPVAERINLGPIREQLKRPGAKHRLVADPADPQRMTTFSAAELQLDGRGHYLYVVFRRPAIVPFWSSKPRGYRNPRFWLSLTPTMIISLLVVFLAYLQRRRFYRLVEFARRFPEEPAPIDPLPKSNDEIARLAGRLKEITRQTREYLRTLSDADRERRETLDRIADSIEHSMRPLRRKLAEAESSLGSASPEEQRALFRSCFEDALALTATTRPMLLEKEQRDGS